MSEWHEEEGKTTTYVDDAGKLMYGDYIAVESEEKPQGEKLKEYILLITEQMLNVVETMKADISSNPVTFVIKQSFDNPKIWTIGWKVFLEDKR